METFTVKVGEVRSFSSGHVQDTRRVVEFEGEELASRVFYTGDDDTRGVTETLYRAENGRLVVHIEDWSRWQGEPSYYSLVEATEDDLEPGGQFEHLAREAGLGRALTLEEALEPTAD